VVPGRRRPRAGVRQLLLLEAPRRALRPPVRPPRAVLVLPAAPGAGLLPLVARSGAPGGPVGPGCRPSAPLLRRAGRARRGRLAALSVFALGLEAPRLPRPALAVDVGRRGGWPARRPVRRCRRETPGDDPAGVAVGRRRDARHPGRGGDTLVARVRGTVFGP